MRRVAASVLLLAVLVVPGLAEPQEPNAAVEVADLDLEGLLDPRVAAVSLHEELASEAPASTFVLTREDIRAHGFRTLAEALRSVPGLWTYSDGFYQYVGFRGVGLLVDYTVRTLVLVDGHPLNNSLGQVENSFGPDLLVPLVMVDRIEIVKGPVGGVYGPAAFLGVVNVVTSTPGGDRMSVVANGDSAQGRAVAGGGSVMATTGAGPVMLAFGAEGSWTRGYDWAYPELAQATDRPAPSGGRVTGMDFGDASKAYVRASWRAATFQGGCGRWYRGLPSAPYSARIGDRRNHEESENCFGQLGLELSPAKGVRVSGRIAHDGIRYRDRLIYDDPEPGGGGDVGPFRDFGFDRWTSADLRVRWETDLAVSATVGATVEHHRTVLDAFAERIPTLPEDPVDGLGVGPIRKSFSIVNGYVIGEWRPVRTFAVHAGLTAYSHSLFGGRVTPKGAVVWRATRQDTVKAILSEGFRAPAASEAFFNDAIDYIPNLDLRPETARAVELAWERRMGSTASLFVSAFVAQYGHLIRVESVPRPGLVGPPDPADPTDYRQQARNGGRFGTRGVEIGGRVRLASLGEAYGGVVWQILQGEEPANTASWTANASLTSRALWKPLTLALRTALVGPRRKDVTAVVPGTKSAVATQVRLDGSATVEVPGVRGLALELGIQNLLDAATLHPVANDFAPLTEMPETPLTLRLGLRYQH